MRIRLRYRFTANRIGQSATILQSATPVTKDVDHRPGLLSRASIQSYKNALFTVVDPCTSDFGWGKKGCAKAQPAQLHPIVAVSHAAPLTSAMITDRYPSWVMSWKQDSRCVLG
jgi:hypothetical protein